jgi:hypothetical protein
MAALASTTLNQSAAFTPTTLTLGASDTITYDSIKQQILVLYNATAGALTPNVDGASGTTVSVPGTGTTFSVASGYTFPSIAAGAYAMVRLDSISAYLSGAITITGGTGIKAVLLDH